MIPSAAQPTASRSTQYEAALRVYFYARMIEAQPALFSPGEAASIRQWFADINRRALTVEWVDWMYALAFSKWPEGPYENQENGAGLLAALEWSHLADPALSPANRDYLGRNRRGWEQRFRNTDDAIIYQPEWIANAYLQSLYWGQANARNERLSFDWLMLQWLPDGSAMGYNYPSAFSPAATELLAASLLGDAQHLWLAGRALDGLEAANGNVGALPGMEQAPQGAGVPPSTGSCLMYGDSGLPNQLGPLAPDKIVFRDGWSGDSAYLLLNLRFTGWHRYKATNTVTLLYQQGALVSDEYRRLAVHLAAQGTQPLPRQAHPARGPERGPGAAHGFGAVIGSLTGLGGFWAQDPPHYATVEQFTPGTAFDTSSTLIGDWHGWHSGAPCSSWTMGRRSCWIMPAVTAERRWPGTRPAPVSVRAAACGCGGTTLPRVWYGRRRRGRPSVSRPMLCRATASRRHMRSTHRPRPASSHWRRRG